MTTRAKTSIKKWINAVTKFITHIPCPLNCQMLMNFSGIEFNVLYLVLKKELENPGLDLMSSTKHEITMFHVKSWSRRDMYKKIVHLLFWKRIVVATRG